MKEKLKAYWDKAKEFLKKYKKIAIISGSVLLAVIIAVIIVTSNRPYAVLFADLTTEDMTAITAWLDSENISEYRVQDGNTILVPETLEPNLKMRLTMEGLPNSGYGYKYSLSSGMLSTESERAQATRYDLQDRMSAVVRNYPGVREAVVTITLGENTSYILDSDRAVPASASVYVELETGATLTQDQAAAIRRLIAHSVKGLDIDSVTIEDGYGNRYASGTSGDLGDASSLKLQMEQQYEDKIRSKVITALTPYFGQENLRVAVNCFVDVSQEVEDSTEVHLPDWANDGSTNGAGIIGSRIFDYVILRGDDEAVGGVVGSSVNSDFPEYVEDMAELDGDETQISAGSEVIYDNSRSESHIIRAAGYLTDCTISVSVNATAARDTSIRWIEQHVARAAGIVGTIDETTGEEYLADKISVVCRPFYEDPVIDLPGTNFYIETWMLYAAAGALLVIIALVVLFSILARRRRKRKMRELEEKSYLDAKAFLAKQAAQTPQAVAGGANVMTIQSERSMELRQEIREFTEENPEMAAQMIKSWLRGGDDNV